MCAQLLSFLVEINTVAQNSKCIHVLHIIHSIRETTTLIPSTVSCRISRLTVISFHF